MQIITTSFESKQYSSIRPGLLRRLPCRRSASAAARCPRGPPWCWARPISPQPWPRPDPPWAPRTGSASAACECSRSHLLPRTDPAASSRAVTPLRSPPYGHPPTVTGSLGWILFGGFIQGTDLIRLFLSRINLYANHNWSVQLFSGQVQWCTEYYTQYF